MKRYIAGMLLFFACSAPAQGNTFDLVPAGMAGIFIEECANAYIGADMSTGMGAPANSTMGALANTTMGADMSANTIFFAGRGCCSRHGGQSGKCLDGRVVCKDGTISPSCRCFSSDKEGF